MSNDDVSDTPNLARPYCPTCEPDADPSLGVLEVRWCVHHQPSWSGLDDEAVTAEGYLSGSAEAGGDNNRRWCEFFHNSQREVHDE